MATLIGNDRPNHLIGTNSDDLFPRDNRRKRYADTVLSLVLLVWTMPVLLLAMAAIMTVSPGYPVYKSERIGKDGKKFAMFKLRTMCTSADGMLADYPATHPGARDEWPQFVKLRNDPKLIPVVGKWLRVTSIDELPQLLNVLRGDMSLVGLGRSMKTTYLIVRRDFWTSESR